MVPAGQEDESVKPAPAQVGMQQSDCEHPDDEQSCESLSERALVPVGHSLEPDVSPLSLQPDEKQEVTQHWDDVYASGNMSLPSKNAFPRHLSSRSHDRTTRLC